MTVEERNKFIEENLGLVHSRISALEPEAFKNQNYYEDLFQTGVMGFIEGLDHYKEDKGSTETTFSVFWIDARIKEFKRKNRMIIMPQSKYQKAIKFKTYNETLYYSKKEIKLLMNLTDEEFNQYKALSNLLTTQQDGGQNPRDCDRSHYPECNFLDKEKMYYLRKALNCLTQKEAALIEAVYGLKEEAMNMEEYGKTLNVTRQYICKERKRILKKLRKEFTYYAE